MIFALYNVQIIKITRGSLKAVHCLATRSNYMNSLEDGGEFGHMAQSGAVGILVQICNALQRYNVEVRSVTESVQMPIALHWA